MGHPRADAGGSNACDKRATLRQRSSWKNVPKRLNRSVAADRGRRRTRRRLTGGQVQAAENRVEDLHPGFRNMCHRARIFKPWDLRIADKKVHVGQLWHLQTIIQAIWVLRSRIIELDGMPPVPGKLPDYIRLTAELTALVERTAGNLAQNRQLLPLNELDNLTRLVAEYEQLHLRFRALVLEYEQKKRHYYCDLRPCVPAPDFDLYGEALDRLGQQYDGLPPNVDEVGQQLQLA